MRFPKMKNRGGGSAASGSVGTKGTAGSLPRFSFISRGKNDVGADMKEKRVMTVIKVESGSALEQGSTSPRAATEYTAAGKRDDLEGNREHAVKTTVSQAENRDAPPPVSSRKSPRSPRSPKLTSTKSPRSPRSPKLTNAKSPRSPRSSPTSPRKETFAGGPPASPRKQGSEKGKTLSESVNEITHAASSLTGDSDDINNISSKRSIVLWEDPESEEAEGEREAEEVELEPVVKSPKSPKEKATNSFKRKKKKVLDESQLRERHRKACTYLKVGTLDMALTEFEEILAMLIKHYGESHRRVGAALNNVGIVHIRAGRLDDAIDAIEEAVRVRKATLGSEHPKVADSLVELGIALLSQQEHEDSLEIFNEALEMREREADDASIGDKFQCTIQVAKILNNLGCVYFEFGALNDALKTYEEALEIQRDAMEEMKEDNPSYDQASLALASTLCNMGYVNMENSDWGEAVENLDEAYSIQASTLEFGNTLTLNTLDNLAYSNAMNWNNRAALKFYEEMLADQSESLGPQSFVCASTRVNIAILNIRLCHYEEALKHLLAAEEIQESKLSPKSRRLEKTRDMIGSVRYETLKFPTPAEVFNRTMTRGGVHNPITQRLLCACGNGEVNEMDVKQFSLSRPEISSKMSGHKVSYA